MTTYGWMFFVFAVVSGGLLTSNIGKACTKQATGMSTAPLQLENFGLNTEGELQLLLQNVDPERLDHTIESVKVLDTTNGRQVLLRTSRPLPLGDSTTLSLDNFSHVKGCRTLEVVIKYDRGNVLENQRVTGTLQAQIKLDRNYTVVRGAANYRVTITDTSSPLDAGETLSVDYTVENTGSASGQVTAKFYFDGSLQDTRTHAVDPGATVSGSFSMDTSGLDGEYPVRVSAGSSSDTTMVEISGGSGTSPSPSPSPARYLLGVNVSTPAHVDIYSNGTLEAARDVADYSTFNLSRGNYTVNASAQDYQEASARVELDSDTNVSLVLQQYPPQVTKFNVVDSSECHGFWCFLGRGNGAAEYEVSWNVTDRYGELQSASILVNSQEEFTGKAGTETYRDPNGWGSSYTIRLKAVYPGTTLCREVTDTADSDSPPASEYSAC